MTCREPQSGQPRQLTLFSKCGDLRQRKAHARSELLRCEICGGRPVVMRWDNKMVCDDHAPTLEEMQIMGD